ncbi:MAG: hypothetical protein H6742_04340 [Alphaproteobacteria bacterium]|nr:hypothetical protein [Alphaproteobacteria bacterium]
MSDKREGNVPTPGIPDDAFDDSFDGSFDGTPDDTEETEKVEPVGAPPAGSSSSGRPSLGRPTSMRIRAVEDYPDQELNPYLRGHLDHKPEVLAAEEGKALRGHWQDAFLRPAPLHVEIGPGNGFFLSGMAARHPERNWLGIEIRFKRVVLTARKLRAAGCENGRVLRYDAHYLDDLFAPGEIAALYVNHPDPWEKDKRAKHRLLRRPFAEWICRAVASGGLVRIKTDYRPNLDDFLALCHDLPLRVDFRCDDIAAEGSPWGDDDVRTNYQGKFDERGEPVYGVQLTVL